MQNRATSRFTLTDLMVILAVLTVLAALLFPTLAQARRKSVAATCGFNMKQIGEAMRLYTNDYDGLLPRADYCVAPDPSPTNPATATGCVSPYGQRVYHIKWEAFLVPYVKNVNLFFCPTRKAKSQSYKTDQGYGAWKDSGEIYYSYALNLSLSGFIIGNQYYAKSFLGDNALTALKAPGQTMLFMEFIAPTTSSYYPRGGLFQRTASGAFIQHVYPMAYHEVWNYYLQPGGTIDTNLAPHDGGLNVVYADGHTGFLRVTDFLSKCPTSADYSASSAPAFGGANPVSTPNAAGNFNEGDKVSVKGDWPFWGLYAN